MYFVKEALRQQTLIYICLDGPVTQKRHVTDVYDHFLSLVNLTVSLCTISYKPNVSY